eukprot:6193986-Alexandrium_andersonii.AAC.1
MSASLVGSEMCIRDRRAQMLGPVRCGIEVGTPRPCSATLPASRVLRRAPVSYTHLTLPTICSV